MRHAFATVLPCLLAACSADPLSVDDLSTNGRRDLAINMSEGDLEPLQDLAEPPMDDLVTLPDLLPPPLATLSFAAPMSVNAGPAGLMLVTDDFNLDGRADIAVANSGGGDVTVLLGNGNGTFKNGVAVTVSTPRRIAVGDFNGDKRKDLVVFNGSGQIYVALGRGNGSFEAPVGYPVEAMSVSGVAVDLDGDHRDDVVALQSNADLDVFLSKPDGTLKPFQHVANPKGTSYDLLSGDLDRDGRADLVNAAGPDFNVHFSNGKGGFDPPQSVVYGGNGAGPGTFLDFDLDGKLDLAMVGAQVWVVRNQGNRTFDAGRATPLGGTAVAAADFDRDGYPDLVTSGAGGDMVNVARNKAGDGFEAPRKFPAGTGVFGIAVADFNGDQLPDIAVANNNAMTVSVLLNTSH